MTGSRFADCRSSQFGLRSKAAAVRERRRRRIWRRRQSGMNSATFALRQLGASRGVACQAQGWDFSCQAFEPAETASLNCWARRRAISLGDSSNCLIHFMTACANAVADSPAPKSHMKKPTQSNTTPDVIQLRLSSSAGREVELLIIVLISEHVVDTGCVPSCPGAGGAGITLSG
jgi:hypothetical protein